MGDYFVLFLSALYLLLGFFLVRQFLITMHETMCGNLFVICHVMYILIYCLIPMLVHYHVYSEGQLDGHYSSLDYTENGKILFLFNFFSVIVGYIGFLKGYFYKNYVVKKNTHSTYTPKTWLFTALVCMGIGIFCLYMWTKVYGGPHGILVYASSLRSGYDIGIDNPYTVYKRFVPLVLFASMIFFAWLIKIKKLILVPFFLCTFYYSILYLLANDGRAPLVMYVLSLFLLFVTVYSKKVFVVSAKGLIKICFVGSLALLSAHNYDKISYDFYEKEKDVDVDYDLDIMSSIREEFSFTVRSNQAVLEYLEQNPMSFRMPLEILSGVLGVLPSSFRPKNVEKLETINTRIWDKKRADDPYFGGRPPDLIVTGIYTLNIFGIFLLPFILGFIIKYVESIRNSVPDRLENCIFYSLVLYPVARIVSYTNFDGLMLNFFYIFIGYVILKIVNLFLYD